jgi:uncharacterized protein (DUF433 family)
MERITIDPEVCNGKPCIRGMRITVKTILEYIAAGETTENILNAYPVLQQEDIKACLVFASRMADHSFISSPLKAS